MKRNQTAALLALWLALSVCVLLLVPPSEQLGLYYDEAFLAQQARDFLEPDRATQHPPGTRSTFLLGRPFPLRNAAYLGSLKSQLLIPALALFGAEVTTLRIATLLTGLVGLLFLTLWARRIFGARVAAIAAILVAFDPSFVFFSMYEWGPYTTLLLCRGFGLWALTRGWQERQNVWMALGGLAFGLGVYSRADFALIVAAFGLGLLAARGHSLLPELRERMTGSALACAMATLGAAPMLLAIAELLQTSAGIASRGGLGYKAKVLWSTLDGSHFHRVIEVGGLFDELFAVAAPATLFGFATAACVATLSWWSFRAIVQNGPRTAPRDAQQEDAQQGDERAMRFVLVSLVVLALAMWLLPGAVRAHHTLNLLPLPHLAVAMVLGRLDTKATGRRVATAAVLLLVLASNARVLDATLTLIEQTGGRGRFSSALTDFASELDAPPRSTAIALDWGFHEPLLFLTRDTQLHEPIWMIPRALQAGKVWAHQGDPSHHYLIHDKRYDLFGLSPKLLASVRRLDPALYELRPHRDRQGEIAFYSVRFTKPHQLRFNGEFEVRFR